MQDYRLLGLINSPLKRSELSALMKGLGWRVLNEEVDETVLYRAPVTLVLDSDDLELSGKIKTHQVLVNMTYTGFPEVTEDFLGELGELHSELHYSFDLFGDAARLVRRCIR